MKKKIIHILCHSLENDSMRDCHAFSLSWAAKTAKSILKYSNNYQNEVWYAIRNLDKKIVVKKDNIVYKLFPAKTLHPALESYFAILKCQMMFDELSLENTYNTLIHFQGERGNLLHRVLSEYSQFKIVVQYHGYGQPSWFEWFEKLFITPIEKKNFIKATHFFVHIKKRIEYLKNELKINADKISYHNVGVDFNIFRPRSKKKARLRLNIPFDRFVILYVGHMVSTKGVDKIIQAYKTLKKKYPKLYLVFVGTDKSDPLYKKFADCPDRVEGILTNPVLPYYYNAADVYCFYGDEKTINYAGPGTAPTEALASNLNVISTNLIHFPNEIVNKLGLTPKSFVDFIDKIEFLIQNPKFKFKPRVKIAKYTANEHQTKQLLKIYDQLFAKKN